jgi:hypothetical protein
LPLAHVARLILSRFPLLNPIQRNIIHESTMAAGLKSESSTGNHIPSFVRRDRLTTADDEFNLPFLLKPHIRLVRLRISNPWSRPSKRLFILLTTSYPVVYHLRRCPIFNYQPSSSFRSSWRWDSSWLSSLAHFGQTGFLSLSVR